MKVVILAGGMGSRISEESQLKPKPMIEIGNNPILWHIMKIYASFGFTDFIICCGYKGYMIKEYFTRYYMYQSVSTFDMNTGEIFNQNEIEHWKVTLADTGLKTLTAGRILKIREYLDDDENFLLTYGDGVSDVDIKKLIEFHLKQGKIATITATQPAGRFGSIHIEEKTGQINSFKEKCREEQSWVNAGFMILNKSIFEYLGDGSDMLENSPFEKLARDGEMNAYRHFGFWSPMDTMRDKLYLDSLWKRDVAPWKIW